MTTPTDRHVLVAALSRSGLLFPEFIETGRGKMFVTEAALLEMIREFNSAIAPIVYSTTAIRSIVSWLTNELDHASFNDMFLADGQGVSPGERVPAIRASTIEAIIERIGNEFP